MRREFDNLEMKLFLVGVFFWSETAVLNLAKTSASSCNERLQGPRSGVESNSNVPLL
jgi:hypothetical protein